MSADSNSALGNTRRIQNRVSRKSLSRNRISPQTDSAASTQNLPPSYSPPTSFAQALPAVQEASLDWVDSDQPDQTPSYFPRAQAQLHSILNDQVTPLRLAGHLSVLAVATIILFLSRVEIPKWELPIQTPTTATSDQNSVSGAASFQLTSAQIGNDALQRAAVPFTIIQERGRETIEQYTVVSGDTVLGIAEKYGLQPETIQWSNPGIEQNPDLLRIGDTLNIPPVDGVLHTVAPGDTLSSLASKYKVDIETISSFGLNNLADPNGALVTGQAIFVPGGTKPFVPKAVVAYSGPIPNSAAKGSGSFGWPASGSITQRYWGGHPAIDVGSWTGSPVKAADSGYVVVAGGGWNGGYGNHVIVDHGNGFVTLYAHLNSIFVRAGESVSRGQQVGTVGNTGNSTGPHLHFEIRYQGVPQNPFNYLP